MRAGRSASGLIIVSTVTTGVAMAIRTRDFAITQRDGRDPSARHHQPSYDPASAKPLSRTDGGGCRASVGCPRPGSRTGRRRSVAQHPGRRAGEARWRRRDARSRFRVLVVGRAVAVVVESRDLFRAEARGVLPDGVGAVLVPVLGVPDQVSLSHVEALRFALAGLDQRRERGVDVVVWVLGPSGHALRLLRPFALVDHDSRSAQSDGATEIAARWTASGL